MGAQWKQAGRVANATKRGQVIGKLVRELMIAAKLGGAHADTNARLAAALEAARKASVPRDTIERAIKKGAGLTDEKINYENVVYEGFAPEKVPVIIECLTDNRNRTAPEIRHLFKDGQFGSPGSVTWMFEHLGVVEAHHENANQDIEEAAIEAGAQNVENITLEDIPEGHIAARFVCNPTDLDAVSKYLTQAKWKVTTSEMSHIAKNLIEVAPEKKQAVIDFLNAIDDHDDVHRIYTALKP